ncbi:hypothetical protein [Frankia sp. Cr1]|uniref:hypothetical protein n=1 Tax=Frankia sp. Cr1 TaxID=3073931 RepID=UPI002AD1D0F0|nr:hypothetical protein [Frankia sp. Cr1]
MPPSRRPLTAHAAEISTATVEIKTLTVSGKQVTLAVFRQLYDEPLYDLVSWEPLGVPWCRVNYHPDKCADARVRDHEHVVWQKGDELRRARIDRPRAGLWDVPIFGYDDEAAVCLTAGQVPGIRIARDSDERMEKYGSGRELYLALDMDGSSAEVRLGIGDRELRSAIRYRKSFLGHRSMQEIAEERHAAADPDRTGCVSARAVLEARVRQCASWQIQAEQRWEEIQSLDQVFIAV